MAEINKTDHLIVIGDSREMSEIPNEAVNLVITSPPYWQLKDYGHKDQIGFDDSYENYINNLNLVWSECFRVLSPGCRLCINIGDQFARSVYYGRYKVIPIRTEIIKFCETIGLDYMGAIIWQKVTTTNTSGGASIMGSFPYPRNGILKLDYEFILIFKKLGTSPKPTREQKERSKISIEEWNQYFTGHWYFNGVRQEKHLAMFPEELPKRLIKMFSFVGDTVLDPFLGSGTTTLAAMNLQRNSIGYEINDDFLPIIESKLGLTNPKLFGESFQVKFIKQESAKSGFSEKLKQLPYIFQDNVMIDKKIDPRKLKFGSKIQKTDSAQNGYHRIRKILDVNLLELDSGAVIKLIGVEPLMALRLKAIEYLKKLVLNEPIYLKYDEVKYIDDENLLAYVYLKNKTFVNAKLIKAGLANPIKNYDYKYKDRFKTYSDTAQRK